MGTSYYVKAMGSNPLELEKLENLKDELEDNDIAVPKELEDKIKAIEDSEPFNIDLDGCGNKKVDGIKQIDNGFLIDLSKFPGTKFIEFGWC